VETAEQAEHLRNLGCLSAQGYYFSKPLPSEQIPALLAKASAESNIG
jgi:EAL domain-containing protein (putative c-di-GMP-specific phosphodiesterase class I)